MCLLATQTDCVLSTETLAASSPHFQSSQGWINAGYVFQEGSLLWLLLFRLVELDSYVRNSGHQQLLN